MTIPLGGPLKLIDAVKVAGGTPGPMTEWVTSSKANAGFGFLDSFFTACKAKAVTPQLFFWIWGDNISPSAIVNGVTDKYNPNVFITADKCESWARTIATKAKAAGVDPIVVIEHESQKNGVENNTASYNAYFIRIADAMKSIHPAIKTVFCSAIWVDQAKVATNFAPCIAKADIIGLQTLLFPPRHTDLTQFRNAGPNLAKAFATLRGTSTKPAAIIDLGFSTYTGGSTTPPFLGGDGRGGDQLQLDAIKSIVAAAPGMNLQYIVYRTLNDYTNFNTANFGGEAEKWLGVIRTDGTKKPAYAALLGLVVNPVVAPKTYTQIEMDAVNAQLAASQKALVDSQTLLAATTAKFQNQFVRIRNILDEP